MNIITVPYSEFHNVNNTYLLGIRDHFYSNFTRNFQPMFSAICSEFKNFYYIFLLGYPRKAYLPFTRISIFLIELPYSESHASCCPVLLGIHSIISPSLRLHNGSFYSEKCFPYISTPLCLRSNPPLIFSHLQITSFLAQPWLLPPSTPLHSKYRCTPVPCH